MVQKALFAMLSEIAVISLVFCSSNANADEYPRVNAGGIIAAQYVYDWSEDAYDPNSDADKDEKTNITIGLSYYFTHNDWNRVSLNYEIRDDKTFPTIGNFLTMQLQILF